MLRLLLLILALLSLLWMTAGDLEDGSWLGGLPLVGMAHNAAHNNSGLAYEVQTGQRAVKAFIAGPRLTWSDGIHFGVFDRGREITIYERANAFDYLRADAEMHLASQASATKVAEYFRAYTRSSLGGIAAIGQTRAWWCDALGWFGPLAEKCGVAE